MLSQRVSLDAYDEVLSGYQPGKVVPFCKDQRFEDHLCLRPQGRWVEVYMVDNPIIVLYTTICNSSERGGDEITTLNWMVASISLV
jgi:hypothetical protein